jgi:Zn-dependent protease
MLLTPATSSAAAFVFHTAVTFIQINVVLMIFNLLPIPPLDGWRVLLGFLDARTAFSLRQYEQYGFIVLLLLVFAGGTLLSNVIAAVMRFLLGL